VPTYAYEFNDRSAPERYLAPVGFPYGAAHESEVQYLFSLQNTPFPGVLTPPQQELAAAMKQYWTNLAKTGVPNSLTEPLWPRFDHASQQMLSLVPPPATGRNRLRRRTPLRVLGPRQLTLASRSVLRSWPAALAVMPADRLMPSGDPRRPLGWRMQAAVPSSGPARRPRRGLRSGHPAETGRHRARRAG
jgi:hypothetical protein